MNTMQRIAALLAEAQEALETLAGGEAGMLDEGTTRDHITAMIKSVSDMTGFLEDEFGKRLTRVDDLGIEIGRAHV